jgi:oxaloacetate decarboxylase alpha subunit
MKIKIVETSLRDGQQSLIATRMTTQEILSVIDVLDLAGYYALEVWGGATFDSCLRFLNEDPWQRLRLIKSRVKNTKLQMLLRGQNLVGYQHYPDQVVDLFIKKSIENGIDILRVFDALNDFNNIKQSLISIKRYGGHCQIALSYTTSPVHNVDYFVNLAVEAEKLGADSICIKDMAGLLLPQTAYDLVRKIKKVTTIPLNLHSHDTSGVISSTYLKAIEAGVDIIDTALSPFSGGTSQPSTEGIVSILSNIGLETKVSIEILEPAIKQLEVIRDKYIKNGALDLSTYFDTPMIFDSQVPGGMYSNLISQLKEQKIFHRMDEILIEIPKVRKDLGFPPLVTPISQIVGVQATLNVITEERYKVLTREIIAYCNLAYGKPPTEVSSFLIEKTKKNQFLNETKNDKNIISSTMAKYKKQSFSDEVILSIILFREIAERFYLNNWINTTNLIDNFNFMMKQNYFRYKFDSIGRNYEVNYNLLSPFEGKITQISIYKGEAIRINEPLLIITVNDINIELLAPSGGIVEEIHYSINQKILKDQLLISIKKL